MQCNITQKGTEVINTTLYKPRVIYTPGAVYTPCPKKEHKPVSADVQCAESKSDK